MRRLVKLSFFLFIAILPSSLFAEPNKYANEPYLETRSLTPAIWIDPDGCEHWVIDLGAEGMMSPHLDRSGKPVCGRNPNICMEFSGDTLFATDSAVIPSQAVERLRNFFEGAKNKGYSSFVVSGHTDSDGSDQYNMGLSQARAQAVAEVAQAQGVGVRVLAMGESKPIASNATADGKRRNRRVEIICE